VFVPALLVLASFPGLGPEWIAAPSLRPDEYAHFSRHVPNAPDEVLFAAAHVCDCDPGNAVNVVERMFDDKPAAVVTRDAITACGRTVEHVVVVGVADVTGRKNIDLYAFRNADTLVVISFLFTKSGVLAADETSMQALCPAAPAA
jgi:hypothetical protein